MFLANVLVTFAVVAFGQAATPQAPSPAAPASGMPTTASPAPRAREDMAGAWTYNAEQSVNAATGRPETVRAANERRGGGGAAGSGGGPRVGGPGGGGPGGPGGPGGGFGGRSPDDMGPGAYSGPPSATFSLMQQTRDTVRDLMEIAPGLTVTVTPANVTITDDLKRTMVFPTDGKKQKYQLGAAIFEAKTSWDGAQLRMDIEGPNGLKMTETLFLSDDGSRLFLLIRIGEQARGERPNGVNRVYDRAK